MIVLCRLPISICWPQFLTFFLLGCYPGGGGGVRFCLDGSLPLEPQKPLPMFMGHSGRKRYPFFKGFFSKYKSILENRTHVQGYFCRKQDPCLGISCEKVTHQSSTSSHVLICEYPRPRGCYCNQVACYPYQSVQLNPIIR